MIIRNLSFAILGIAVGVACDKDDAKPTGYGTVTGSLEDGGSASSASSVQVESVGDDGKTSIVGTGSVQANGSFSVSDVETGNGPFIVRAVDASGATVAAAIMPEDLDVGDTAKVAPLNAETTVESDVLVSVLAGSPAAVNVDTIGLMQSISAEQAANASGSATTTTTLGAAFVASQDAWLATVDGNGSATTAAKLEAAKLGAWGSLVAALDAAANASARADAWADFDARIYSDVRVALGLDAGVQADAESASGIVFTSQFAAESAGHMAALRNATMLSAHADWSAQHAAAASSSAAAAVDAKLTSAYTLFLTTVATATTEADIEAASVDLSAAISGRGTPTPMTSALGILVAAESTDDAAAFADVDTALDVTVDEATTLRTAVDAALAGSASARADAVAAAYVDFRTDIDAGISGSLGSLISASVTSFTTEVAAQSRAHLGVILDLDLLGTIAGVTLSLSGIVDDALSLQDDGAIGMVTSTFNAFTGATSAALVSVSGAGVKTDIATGTIDSASHRFSFENVTNANGTLVIELRNAANMITGAAILDGSFTGSSATGNQQVTSITEESTVETKVFLARLVRGETTGSIDRANLELMVDAAVAASATTEADIQTLASASFAAETVRASALGSDRAALAAANYSALTTLHASLRGPAGQADAAYIAFRAAIETGMRQVSGASVADLAIAQAQASLVFQSVIEHRAPVSQLAQVSDARAKLEAAYALDFAVSSAFDASSFGNVREVQLSTAVSTYVTAVTSATTVGQLDAAAATFGDALVGFQTELAAATGVLGAMAQSDLSLTLVQQPAVRLAMTNAITAAATFQTSLDAAVAAADGAAAFDATTFATSWAAAATAFDTSLTTAIDLSTLTQVSVGDVAAMTTLMTHVAMSFGASGDVMN